MEKLENLYRQIIMEHYKNPKNKGLVDHPAYIKHHIKNPTCGDDITIQTHVQNNRVIDIRHEGSGCSICCSSASVLSVLLKDKPVEEARAFVDNYLRMLMDKPLDPSIDLEDAWAYQGVRKFPARIKCASIAWKAFDETLKKGGSS